MKNKKYAALITTLVGVIAFLYFFRFPLDGYCCQSPVHKWKFAIYTGECDDETGCHFLEMKNTGFAEYVGLKEIPCPCDDFAGKTQITPFDSDTLAQPKPYADFLKDVSKQKKALPDVASAKGYLFQIFNTDIPRYWTGTEWDFNGVTRQPKKGEIACGYFITNTLTDVGFDLPRIKLAQAASSEMIKELCIDVKRFADFDKLKAYMQQQPDNSVFIVGLDFHTGYLLKTKEEVYFLHSNYIGRQGVMKEQVDASVALKSSKSFMIGNLTANEVLMKKWMK